MPFDFSLGLVRSYDRKVNRAQDLPSSNPFLFPPVHCLGQKTKVFCPRQSCPVLCLPSSYERCSHKVPGWKVFYNEREISMLDRSLPKGRRRATSYSMKLLTQKSNFAFISIPVEIYLSPVETHCSNVDYFIPDENNETKGLSDDAMNR